MNNVHHQTEIRHVRKQLDGSSRTRSRRSIRDPGRELRQRPMSLVALILFFGVAGEVIVPWLVIWLSDVFVFDIPAWATWAMFGGPLVVGLLAAMVYWKLRVRRRQSSRVLAGAAHGH
jgi:hypothetical protein